MKKLINFTLFFTMLISFICSIILIVFAIIYCVNNSNISSELVQVVNMTMIKEYLVPALLIIVVGLVTTSLLYEITRIANSVEKLSDKNTEKSKNKN